MGANDRLRKGVQGIGILIPLIREFAQWLRSRRAIRKARRARRRQRRTQRRG